MRDDRVLRILRPSLALAVLAAVLVLLGTAVAGPAHAATQSPKPAATTTAGPVAPATTPPGAIVLEQGSEVQFGNDVFVPTDATMPSVVVFGGDITIEGAVTDAVVAFGGDVTINGTVGASTVAFGGDVTLGPDAVLGSTLPSSDPALVLFGGELTRAPGAQVNGQIQTFAGLDWGAAAGWLARGLLLNPLGGLSFWGWAVQTAFFLVLALVVAALMPHQLRGLQRHLGGKPWASLGWGALIVFLVAPAILVVLVISLIGLLLVLPYGLFVLLAYFFVTTGVAAFVAQKVITGFGGKENLMLAVTIGVVGTTVASRIPVAGPVLVTIMMVFGAGAAALGVAEWRHRKREEAAALAASSAAAAAWGAVQDPNHAAPYPPPDPHYAASYPPPRGAAATPVAVINPIVQTSPTSEAAAAPVAPAPDAAATPVAAPHQEAAVAPVSPPADAAAPVAPPAPEAPVAPTGVTEAPAAAAPEPVVDSAPAGEEAGRQDDDAGPAPA